MTVEEVRPKDIRMALELNGAEVRHLRNLLNARLRKRRRQTAASTFVPEPGKTDINKVIMGFEEALLQYLDAELDRAGVPKSGGGVVMPKEEPEP